MNPASPTNVSVAHPVLPQGIPPELTARAQWVCWRYVDKGGPKLTKTPYQVNGELASVSAPSTWTTFGAVLAASKRFDGVGFVLTPGLGIVGFDLDGCIDDAGQIAPWAASIVDCLDTYCEISPSNHGLRLLAYGELPPEGRKHGPFECYCEGRYLTFTGNVLGESPKPIASRQLAIDHIHREQFPSTYRPKTLKAKAITPPYLADAALLAKARTARNGPAFVRLWNGDITGYPSQSEADLALCSRLAFWTDGDGGRMDALFRQSGLYREKWDEQHGAATYGQLTIGKALDGLQDTYSPNAREIGAALPHRMSWLGLRPLSAARTPAPPVLRIERQA